jgi:hypothetical protein
LYMHGGGQKYRTQQQITWGKKLTREEVILWTI